VNARDFALHLLDSKRLPGWKPAALPRSSRAHEPADPRDRALGERIATGVVKNLLRLQNEVQHYSGKSPASIEPLVQKILAIALYQMKFMDRIPPSAAVDEAVGQTRRLGHPRATGFVNAVLRNVARMPAPVEPDANTDPEAYARLVLSHPPELFRRLQALLGNERALAFCTHDNAEPPVILRLSNGVNASRLQDESRKVSADNIELSPHEAPNLWVVAGAGKSVLAHWARLGIAQVQDATSADVVSHLSLHPGLRVLDRCAGMGTKTLQIWEAVGPSGQIVAMDASADRCQTLRRTLTGRGISNVAVHHAQLMSEIVSSEKFDRILIDAPCSNSGVLARRPEARYRSATQCLTTLQRKILDDTLPWLASGGVLVFSTCSIWKEENENLVAEVLQANPRLELLESKTTLPSFDDPEPTHYHDGGYFAALRLKDSLPS
jgi:16S rRNA (cytosine967-C5)-methyltransferase